MRPDQWTSLMLTIVFAFIVALATVGMLLFAARRDKPHPKSEGVRRAVAVVLNTLSAEQLEAVNLWAWAAKAGWNVPVADVVANPDDYPFIAKEIANVDHD